MDLIALKDKKQMKAKENKLTQISAFWNIVLNVMFIIGVLVCIIPILLAVSISLTDNATLARSGYHLIPQVWSLEAYRFVVDNSRVFLNAYGVTFFTTVIGTVLSVTIIALFAYPISRKDFKYRKVFTLFIFITMIFNGGMVPWFMVSTQVLGLYGSIWGMIIPYLFSAWFCIIMRTFFQLNIPEALIEAAKIDGAGEFFIFIKMILPLSLPGIATIALFQTLAYWNDWWLPLMFVSENSDLSNLQFLLYKMLTNIQELANNPQMAATADQIPGESLRMAFCIIAIGPIILAYPFFQKYFVQGLTVGAVKG